MSAISKPQTQKETIDQMWWVLIGANGDGISQRVKRIDERLVEVEKKIPSFMTHDEHRVYVAGCKDEEKEKVKEERRQKWRSTDVILTVGILITAAISAAGAFL